MIPVLKLFSMPILLFCLLVNSADATELPIRDHSRAELLYSTHCGTCHNEQIHWRGNKKAINWTSLKFEVKRWQDSLSLNWSNEDIELVAQYLNVLYYHYPNAELLVNTK